MKREDILLGWREWVSLPTLGVDRIKAKLDTGARTSSLHAHRLRVEEEGDRRVARFIIHPLQRDARISIPVEAEVVDEREIKNSGGRTELRPIIVTPCSLLGIEWPIELALTRRDEMGFRMLLGRQALRGRFIIDPGRSFLAGRPSSGPRDHRKESKA